jgi:hypothetical protein
VPVVHRVGSLTHPGAGVALLRKTFGRSRVNAAR